MWLWAIIIQLGGLDFKKYIFKCKKSKNAVILAIECTNPDRLLPDWPDPHSSRVVEKQTNYQHPSFQRTTTLTPSLQLHSVNHLKLQIDEMTDLALALKRWPPCSWITDVNICGGHALRVRRGFGPCLCQTLCRTVQIRMKYWVHLWISGAERPLVGASACIFSWWKPLDGSFLLAASLKSESQKCNASSQLKKKKDTKMYRGPTARIFFAPA